MISRFWQKGYVDRGTLVGLIIGEIEKEHVVINHIACFIKNTSCDQTYIYIDSYMPQEIWARN